MKYSIEQKKFCANRLMDKIPIRHVQNEYSDEFDPPIPDETTIKRWYLKLRDTGTLADRKHSGRPPVSEANIEKVREAYEELPELPIRKAGPSLDMKPGAVHYILRKKLKLKSYKAKKAQQLKPPDYNRRKAFCNSFIERFGENNLNNVFFSDEAIFSYFYKSNRQNRRKWSDSRPEDFIEIYESKSKRLNVWAGISENKIIGPYFFEGNLSEDGYHQLLNGYFFPAVENLGIMDTVILQQDGASNHYKRNVRELLNNRLPGRWIGRGLDADWPARSPDLTPMDFFFWSYIKNLTYETLSTSMNELKNNIRVAFSKVSNEMLSNTFSNLRKRI